MNKMIKVLLAVTILSVSLFAQYVPTPVAQNTLSPAAVGGVGVVTAVNTTTSYAVNVSPGPVFCQGALSYIATSQIQLSNPNMVSNSNTASPTATWFIAYSCLSDQLTATLLPSQQSSTNLLLATVVVGCNTCLTASNDIQSITATTGVAMFPLTSDSTYIVPLTDCQITIGAAGTFAAAVLTGTGNSATNPGPFRTATGSTVLQAITTGAASNLNTTCDITPSSKLTTGKGVIINNVQLFYGDQTTALTSITAPTVQSLTYPATGAAAGLTNAAAGGALTVTPGSLQLTTTTSGQCFSENIAMGTPIPVITDLQRVTLDQTFNQAGAAAQTLQICGVIVHYTNIPL